MMPRFKDFDRLCQHLAFSTFPRSIGNPRQQFTYTTEDIWSTFRKWNGDSSCFISTQGYDNLIYEQGGRQVPRSILYGLTFFDFDHETKAENAFADAQRLSQFLREHNVAHWVQYSGSKGYHLQIVHEPTRFKFDPKDGSAESLREIVHQVQAHLKSNLGLNTLDAQTMGDPKRLCRFPFTAHVDRFGKTSGRYALPIELNMLDSVSHDEIVKSASTPNFFFPEISGDKLTLKQFIDLIGVNLSAPETRIKPMIQYEFGFNDVQSETARYLASMDNKCMGVVNELKRRNPNHKARVHSAMFAKSIGINQEAFERIWVALGQKVGYVDLHNAEYRAFQMASIFDNERMTTPASCSTLKRDGCCVGEICPKFKDSEQFFADQASERKIKRRWRKK